MAENDPAATYTQYAVERGTTENPGIVGMPVAGPAPQNASVVILHAPIAYTWIAWSASRIGAPCVMPDPYGIEQYEKNLVYVGGQVSAIVPHPTGTGTHIFSQSGVYYYLNQVDPSLIATIPLGKMPWEQIGPSQNDITPDFFTALNMSQLNSQPPSPLPQPLLIPIRTQ